MPWGCAFGDCEWKGGDVMADDEGVITEILRSIGVLDFVMGKVKDQAELIQMFKNDFESLMALCAEGK
jgi:hypothetical protein